MRTEILLAASVLALSACAPAAQGASESIIAARASSAAPASAEPSTKASASLSPGASPWAGASAGPTSSPSATPTVDPTVSIDPAPPGSFVLGDSISLSAGVGPVLGRYGYPVVGRVGQSVSDAYLRTHLTSPTAQLAPGWVIELGTNNGGQEADVARLVHWIDLIESLRTPGRKQHVQWVTPYRPADFWDPSQGSELDAFNQELSRLAESRRWLRLLDFAALAKASPDWFIADALHVHPNAEGEAAMVALIAGTDPVPVPHPLVPSDAAPEPTPDPTLDEELNNPALDHVFSNTPPPVITSPEPSPAAVEPAPTASPAPPSPTEAPSP